MSVYTGTPCSQISQIDSYIGSQYSYHTSIFFFYSTNLYYKSFSFVIFKFEFSGYEFRPLGRNRHP